MHYSLLYGRLHGDQGHMHFVIVLRLKVEIATAARAIRIVIILTVAPTCWLVLLNNHLKWYTKQSLFVENAAVLLWCKFESFFRSWLIHNVIIDVEDIVISLTVPIRIIYSRGIPNETITTLTMATVLSIRHGDASLFGANGLVIPGLLK